MLADVPDEETRGLLHHYLNVLSLPTDRLRVTTCRRSFSGWLGRRVSSSLGGAYAYLPRCNEHLVLVNLARIDRSQPRAVEIVVAEELIHMRDRLDGDHRRHARHGYDRIADRVAALTGATLEEIRTCLLPVQRRPFRYLYACPGCGRCTPRRVQGTWSCRWCASRFDPRFVLRLVADLDVDASSNGMPATHQS
ncbi:MAG: hypothetical protein M3R02_04080 [Chloroflexota bacterium]|nr:hypothetical protein [Chloroflexota bacterium]